MTEILLGLGQLDSHGLRRILAAGFHERSPKRADGIGHTHRGALAPARIRIKAAMSDRRFMMSPCLFFAKQTVHDPTTKEHVHPAGGSGKEFAGLCNHFFESIGEDGRWSKARSS